jgi:protein phosphatase PTC7
LVGFPKVYINHFLSIEVHDGDLLVLGTDGLFDNMFPEDIAATVKTSVESKTTNLPISQQLEKINLAERIAKKAQEYALDHNRDSPFAILARKAGRFFKGGKIDDITVIVSLVTTSAAPHSKL